MVLSNLGLDEHEKRLQIKTVLRFAVFLFAVLHSRIGRVLAAWRINSIFLQHHLPHPWINSIFLQPRYYCLKGSTSTTSITQHRNSLPRWMTFLSLDSLNESPFFGTVLHNQFLMGKLWKEYILTLSMKSKSNPCPTVIDSTLISTFLTMEVSKLHKKVKKLAFIKSSSGDERYFRRILYKPKTMYP